MQQQDVLVKKPSKSYKSKIQAFVKLQQKEPKFKDSTCDRILEQFIKSEIQIISGVYSSTIFDKFMKLTWEYQVSQNFLKKLIAKSQKVQTILSTTLLILDGYFDLNNIKFQTTHIKVPRIEPFQSFFVLSSQDNYKILFEIGLHKQFIKCIKSDMLEFEVKQKITIIDILFCCTQTEIVDCIMEYQRQMLKNFSRTEYILSELKAIQANQKQQIQQKQQYLFSINCKNWPEALFTVRKDQLIQYIPIQFVPIQYKKQDYIKEDISQQFVSKKFYQIQMQRKIHESLGNENKYKLKQYADFESAGQILDLIQKSPNFKIKLSQQERQIVSTKNNALIIGRSGTGKTTSIVLRIFATEILLKVRSKLFGQKKLQLLSDLNGNKIVLHQILSTANSVLIQEIEKYYKKLLNIVQDAIEKHRASKRINLDETFLSEAESEITNYENDVLDFVDENNDISYSQISQGSSSNQFQKQVTQMENLNFPSFLSTLNLLLLLDQRCSNPYFSEEKVRGLYKKHCRQAGFRDCNGVNLNEWFQHFIYSTQQLSDESSRFQNMQIIVPEVDFNIFLLDFWPNVAPRNRNIFDNLALPSLVWTQIYSFIKGSQYSYLYPNKCLPLSLYQERVQNFLTGTQITDIYEYFLQYEEWKAKRDYYDQLDIVNSLLLNLENKQINQFSIHYSYIDEVQDLPQALIELYCKITEQGVIFSGDTAQSILKGVGFRFSDLQTLFRNSKQIGSNDIEKFQIFQLTINFRSHNSILQFANVIIRIIELLFPSSIDHLQKEISNLQGPKPIIISVNDPNQIHYYLDQQYQSEQQCEIEFGYNQVVLVKNEQVKNALPKSFQNFRILTVAQAKGLEFDDVIIYNFFTAEPLTDQQWQFLTCIDVTEKYIDHEIYDYKITKHKIEQEESANIQKSEDKVKVHNLTLNDKYEAKKIIDFSSLCNELKLLYVCITRAKKRVIIYDDQPERRQYLEKILYQQDVCEKSQFGNRSEKSKYDDNNYSQSQIPNRLTKQTKSFENDKAIEEYRKNWDESGNAMFQRKLYDEAIKCFTKAQNIKMTLLSEAYYSATKGAQELAIFQQINSKQNQTVEQKIQLQQIKNNFRASFQEAAVLFQNHLINDQIKAADCFYSGQNYSEALILYLNQNFYEKANKCAKKLQLRMFQIILNLKIGNLEKCLEYLNKYKVDEFFKYDLLKHGLENGYFDQSFIKEQLIILQKSGNNIFDQLLKKFQGENNDFTTFEEFTEQLCDPNLYQKLNLSEQFEPEINRILQSQIYIDDDLLEMVIEQISVFWDIYYQILSDQMIHNPFNLDELRNSFSNKIYNQHFYDFIQEILEQFNQFNLLIVFLHKQKYIYKSYKESNLIQIKEISQNTRQVKQAQNLTFMYNQKSNIETFILHQIIFKKSYEGLYEISKDFKIHQNYNELDCLLSLFQSFQNNVICVQQYYHKFVCIFNQFKDQFTKGKFDQFDQSISQAFSNNKKYFEYFRAITDVLYKIFKNNNTLIESDINLLFNEQDQIKCFGILYFLIQFGGNTSLISQIFHNFSYVHYVKLFELLIFGQNLFQIAEEKETQKQIFYTICAIKGYYILISKECNFIGINLIFKYNIQHKNYQFDQSLAVTKEIQKQFKPLFQIVFQQFSKRINRSASKSENFLDQNSKHFNILKTFLSQIQQIFMEKKDNYEQGIFEIVSIYFLLLNQIPQSLVSFLTQAKTDSQILENLYGYIQFKNSFKSKQLSSESIKEWLKYSCIKNYQTIQSITFQDELQKIILIILIQFQLHLSQEKITYQAINGFQLNTIIDFEKLRKIQYERKNQKRNQQMELKQIQNENNLKQDDKSKSDSQKINEKEIMEVDRVENQLKESVSIEQMEICSKQSDNQNEQINKLTQESQQEFDCNLGIEKIECKELHSKLEKEEINSVQECQQEYQFIQEHCNDESLDVNHPQETQELLEQNHDDQSEDKKIQQKIKQQETKMNLQDQIKQLDEIDNEEFTKNEDLSNQQRESVEKNNRTISDSNNESRKQLQQIRQSEMEKNLQEKNTSNVEEAIIDQNSDQLINIKNQQNQQEDRSEFIDEPLLSGEEKQQNQNFPLIIFASQEEQLNQMIQSYNYQLFPSNEQLNQFSLKLIKFLLKVIQDNLEYKIVNKMSLMVYLFQLTYNVVNQQQKKELRDEIIQIFQEQDFEYNFIGDNLYDIEQVIKLNDFYLLREQNLSKNKQIIIDSTQLQSDVFESEIICNDSKDIQQMYNKQDLDYFGIRSTFINIKLKNELQKTLIHQKIYNLKNKLINCLSGKQETYIQFKEYSQILQSISNIELEIDGQNMDQNLANQVDQREHEKKLDFWIFKLQEKEEKERNMRCKQSKVQ